MDQKEYRKGVREGEKIWKRGEKRTKKASFPRSEGLKRSARKQEAIDRKMEICKKRELRWESSLSAFIFP